MCIFKYLIHEITAAEIEEVEWSRAALGKIPEDCTRHTSMGCVFPIGLAFAVAICYDVRSEIDFELAHVFQFEYFVNFLKFERSISSQILDIQLPELVIYPYRAFEAVYK